LTSADKRPGSQRARSPFVVMRLVVPNSRFRRNTLTVRFTLPLSSHVSSEFASRRSS